MEMAKLDVPESDIEEITERTFKVAPRDPNDESRYLACRWLNRLFYDVRKWNLGFIKFLKTYPGFQKSRDQTEYQNFFKELAKYNTSLDERYGEAKGELKQRLEKDRLGRRIVGVETSGKMTDKQIVAVVRGHFSQKGQQRVRDNAA